MIMQQPQDRLWEDIHRASDSEKSLMVFNLLYEDLRSKYLGLVLSNKTDAILLRERHIAAVNMLDELKLEYEKLLQDGDTATQALNKGHYE